MKKRILTLFLLLLMVLMPIAYSEVIIEPIKSNPTLTVSIVEGKLQFGFGSCYFDRDFDQEEKNLLDEIEKRNLNEFDKTVWLTSYYMTRAEERGNNGDIQRAASFYKKARQTLSKYIEENPKTVQTRQLKIMLLKADSLRILRIAAIINDMDTSQWEQRLGNRGFWQGETTLDQLEQIALSNPGTNEVPKELQMLGETFTLALDTVHPLFILKYINEITDPANSLLGRIQTEHFIKSQLINILSVIINNNNAYDISSAILFIEQDSKIEELDLSTLKNNYIVMGGGLVNYKQAMLNAIEQDPVLKYAKENQIRFDNSGLLGLFPSDDIIDDILIEHNLEQDMALLNIANQYRNNEQTQAALFILQDLTSSSYSGISSQAESLIKDITGKGTWDFSDEFLSYGMMEIVVQLTNPGTWFVYGAVGKFGSAMLRMTRLGTKLVTVVELSKDSISTIFTRIGVEILWEGVEEGAGRINPSLEWVAMILDGGPDADYYLKKRIPELIKAGTITNSGKFKIDNGKIAGVYFVNDLNSFNTNYLSRGYRRIQDPSGNIIGFEVPDEYGSFYFMKEGASLDNSYVNIIDLETKINQELARVESLDTESRLRLEELLEGEKGDSGLDRGLTWEGRTIATQSVIKANVNDGAFVVEIGVGGHDAPTYRELKKTLGPSVTVNAIELNPENIPVDLKDEIVLGDILNLQGRSLETIKRANIVRISNLVIPYFNINQRKHVLESLQQNMKEGSTLIISHTDGSPFAFPGEEGFLYKKKGSKLSLEKYLYGPVIIHGNLYYEGHREYTLFKEQGLSDVLVGNPIEGTQAQKELIEYVKGYTSLSFEERISENIAQREKELTAAIRKDIVNSLKQQRYDVTFEGDMIGISYTGKFPKELIVPEGLNLYL